MIKKYQYGGPGYFLPENNLQQKFKDKLYNLSRRIMATANNVKDINYDTLPSGEPLEGVAQTTYLLPRHLQKEKFLEYGYKESPGDYGLVKKAVGNRKLPVYQKNPDVISRNELQVVGNPGYTVWFGNSTEALTHAGNYPSAIYHDDQGNLYQKSWDLNDYGGGAGAYTRYSPKEKMMADIGDIIGSPVVVTTGFRPIYTQKGPEDKQANLLDTGEWKPLDNIINSYLNKKGLYIDSYKENGNNIKFLSLPEVIIKGKKQNIKTRGPIKTANARKWKHQLGGNLLLGPMPSAINNPKVKNILSYMPFTGSAIDIETTMKNPSIKNFINAAITTGSDVLGGWLIKDVNKAKKAYNEAKAAEKTAKELLNQSRKSNVIARSVTEEQRRLKDNWEKAYWDLQLKDRQNFIQKYLDYPIYGGWLAGDATINYIQNQKKGGTLKFQEGGKTSWWNKAINFVNNSGLGEAALNALSTYTQNKQIGTSSDVAKAQVDKDKASRIQQANLAAEQEANDIQQNNVNPENPNAMSGDIVKNFIKNKLLSQKMALINQESNQEKAEIDQQTQQLKNQNTTNMWAGIGSTLMQGLGHVGQYMGNKQQTNVSNM